MTIQEPSLLILLLSKVSNLWAIAMSQARPQVRNPLFLHHLEAKQRSSGTAPDQCGNPGGISGTFNFNSLITDGYLTSNGTAAPGMSYRFDNCSQTVRLFCVFFFCFSFTYKNLNSHIFTILLLKL